MKEPSFVKNHYVLSNFIAFILVILLFVFGVIWGIDIYTRHGSEVKIPDVVNKAFDAAEEELDDLGLNICVSDTGYVKNLKPGCILDQVPQPGIMAKSGSYIYVVINANSSPTIPIPDIIDNSSHREAEAKLKAMGFKILPAKTIEGEKEWVYGVEYKGRSLKMGDKVPSGASLRVVIGDGVVEIEEETDSLDSIDSIIFDEGGVDNFEVVE